MADQSINTVVEVKLNGKPLTVPREFFDVSVKASFDQNPQANLTTEEFTFVLDAFKEINSWIDNGLRSGVGIFEGMPITITARGKDSSLLAFNGIVDLQNALIIDQELGEIKAKLRQDNSLNNLSDLLEPLDFGFLLAEGVITEEDYVDIEYVIDKPNTAQEIIITLLTAYLLQKQLQDSIKDIAEQIAIVAGIAASGFTGPIGASIYAVAVAILEIAYAIAILALLVALAVDMIRLLTQPLRTHKGIQLKTLLEKTCEYLGFTLETTIEDLDNLVYLASNITTDDNEGTIFIQTLGSIEEGIPNSRDFGYTCTEIFQLTRDLFNARFLIVENTIQLHTESSPFWIKSSSFKKPDILQGPFRYNTEDIRSSIKISFLTDITDEYTIENFTGTVFQVLTDANTVLVANNKTIKNTDFINIPLALGNRKDQLSVFDEVLADFAGVFDRLINFFGGNSNLKKSITSKIGVLKVSSNNHTIPKLLWLDGGRIPENQRELFSAKTLYEKYHIEKSFVSNNFSRQRKVFENERIPFGFNDFVKVLDNSYFRDTQGKLGKILSLEWNMNKDFAVISYWISNPYTKNLKETFIEP